MTRAVLRHKITREEKSVLLPTLLSRRWEIESITKPTQPVFVREQPDPLVALEDKELSDLALKYNLTVQVLLDKGRAKFGKNLSLAGLIFQIKVRGL